MKNLNRCDKCGSPIQPPFGNFTEEPTKRRHIVIYAKCQACKHENKRIVEWGKDETDQS